MKQGSHRISLRHRDLALLRSLAEARYRSIHAVDRDTRPRQRGPPKKTARSG
jgi:hypothetical protein